MSCVRAESFFLLLCCDLKPTGELLQRKQLPLCGFAGREECEDRGKKTKTERTGNLVSSWYSSSHSLLWGVWTRAGMSQHFAVPGGAAGIWLSLPVLFMGINTNICGLLCQHWLQELPEFSSSFKPIRDKSYQRLFGHFLYLQEVHVPCQWEVRVAFMLNQVAGTAGLVRGRNILRHSNSNTTWQPSDSLPVIIMAPASSFKGISKTPLIADF